MKTDNERHESLSLDALPTPMGDGGNNYTNKRSKKSVDFASNLTIH